MNKLDKPKFFTTPIWANLGLVLGIIFTFSFSKKLSDIALSLVIIGLILIFFSWNLIKYIINWHKLYNSYSEFYQKFTELDTRYSTRIKELKNKDNLIDEYEKFVQNLDFFIIASLTKNSSTEVEQLKNMQSFLYLSIEHLNKLRGGKIDG